MDYGTATPETKNDNGVKKAAKTYIIAAPKDISRCEGCPYPSVGFICWSPDGSCMRTDMEKINRRRKGG